MNTMENESTVSNNDNGVTYVPTEDDSTWLKGRVWSIGLGTEVTVIGHSSDQSEDVWMVTRDDDGDGSPDRAIRRAGADLLPYFRVGDVVRFKVIHNDEQQTTYGLVVSRSPHGGIYLHTALTLAYPDGGAVRLDWANVRERFLAHEFYLARGLDSDLLRIAYQKWQDAETARQTAVIEADRIRDEMSSEMADFRLEVAKVASRYGREHEMCDVLDRALEELGLERIHTRWRVPVTMSGYVVITADNAEKAEERVRYLIDGASLSYSGEENGEDLSVEDLTDKEIGDAEETDED